jgi:uncharacterized protein YjiS (DUF1127 family)
MNRIVSRVRTWISRLRQRAELDHFSATELRVLAQDIGLSPYGLRQITEGNPRAGELLPQRMAALGIHADELARALPDVFRDMQRVCASCRKYGRCARDLDRGALGAEWLEYCPNAHTLLQLEPPNTTLH